MYVSPYKHVRDCKIWIFPGLTEFLNVYLNDVLRLY